MANKGRQPDITININPRASLEIYKKEAIDGPDAEEFILVIKQPQGAVYLKPTTFNKIHALVNNNLDSLKILYGKK